MTVQSAPQREIGYAAEAGPNSYNWWMSEGETTPELRWPQSVQVYDQMRTQDAQIKSVLAAVTFPVRRTPWRIDPNGARDEVVRLVADDLGLPVVGESKPNMPLRTKDRFSWVEHVRLALLMLPFGHMFFEQVYRVSEDGSRAHLRKLGERLPRTIFDVKVARDGGLVSITQTASTLEGNYQQQPIPVNRLVAYVLEKEGGNWLGRSILRPAYKNWLLKDRLLRVQAQTVERNGMGVPTYTGAEGEASLANGKALATSLRAGETAGAAIPYGATLALLGVTGTLPDADTPIRYHDEQIARAVLAHFLNLGTQTGSWALGTTFADFFTLSLQTLADQIADTATQHVVEDLVDINWGPDEPAPRIVHDEIGSRQQATAAAIKSLVDAGIIEPDEVLESSTRQQYGLPPKDPDTTRGQDQGGGAELGQPFYAPPDTGSGSEVYASADIDDDDDDEPGQFDEMTAVLAAALSEFIGEVRAAGLSDWDPSKHPRDKAGRFRTVFARVMHALEMWARGEGGDHPLKGQGFTTANLRTVATKHLGLKVRRSTQNNPVTPEELEDLILEHVRAHVRVVRDDKLDNPRLAKFTLQQSGELRDKDVAVYRMPGDKPALFFENDQGKRGGLVERFDDLDGLQRWADEHGETRLAEWARKEAGGKAPTKAVPSATKAAPAKRVPPAPGFADDLAEEFYRNPQYAKQEIVDRLDGLTVAELKRVATAANVEKPREFHKTEAGPVVTTPKKLTADEWREHIAATIIKDRRHLGSPAPAKAPDVTPGRKTHEELDAEHRAREERIAAQEKDPDDLRKRAMTARKRANQAFRDGKEDLAKDQLKSAAEFDRRANAIRPMTDDELARYGRDLALYVTDDDRRHLLDAARRAKAPTPTKRTPSKAAQVQDQGPGSAVATTPPGTLSEGEMVALKLLSAQGWFTEGGWVESTQVTAMHREHLDALAEKGIIQKHISPNGDKKYRIDPRSVGTQMADAEGGGALVGDIIPAVKPAESTLPLAKVNRGAIIDGHVGKDGTFTNEATPGSRPVRVVVQRVDPLDQHGQPITRPLMVGGLGGLGHFQFSGEKPQARIIGHDVDTGRRIESAVVPANSQWEWLANPSDDTSPDIEGELVPERPRLASPAPAKKAPGGAAKAEVPPPDASDPEALRDALDLRTVDQLKAMLRERGLPVSGRKRELVDRLVAGGGVGPKGEPAKAAPAKPTGRTPATPVPIRDLFDADDATIETALKDVFEGKFGPYTTKARVFIRRAGTRVDKRGRERAIAPSIGVEGDILDADGNKIGHFGRGIDPVDMHYADGTVRREMWANHSIVELGEGDYDENPTKYHGKGFGGEFNRRAIQWYRDSGVHGISQHDHNGYVWASQGFNFGQGGRVPDYLAENMRELIADLRAGKRTSNATKDEYRTIPKRFRDASDLDAQIAAAEALLARLNTTKPGEPGYPTAYEISQLGRRAGQRGKTALWFGKLLFVSADEMILNPDEGEVISQ